MMHNRKLLEQALVALKVSTTPLPEDRQTVLAAVSAIQEQLAQPETFFNRREVMRAIESIENPSGMSLNDGKERPILPMGTLKRMLAIIDDPFSDNCHAVNAESRWSGNSERLERD